MNDLKLGFSAFGFIIWLMQLLPGTIWLLSASPTHTIIMAQNQLLRYGESYLKILVLLLLLFLVNKSRKSLIPASPWTKVCFAAMFLGWFCSFLIYRGFPDLTIGLAAGVLILPTIAFGAAGLAQRSRPLAGVSAALLVVQTLIIVETLQKAGQL